MSSDTSAKKPEQKSEQKPRLPQPGSPVEFQGWTNEEKCLHAVAAHAVGDRVTVSYLTKNGVWLSAHLAPYDATGETSGSWRWPKR